MKTLFQHFWIATLTAFGVVAITFAQGRENYPPARPDVAELAREFEGSPYLYGGSDPGGFDCSGFAMYTYRIAGTRIPRSTGEQFDRLAIVPGEPRRGDLVFFSADPGADGITHVGVFLGDADQAGAPNTGGRWFIHAPKSGDTVRLERFDVPYWQDRFRGARTAR